MAVRTVVTGALAAAGEDDRTRCRGLRRTRVFERATAQEQDFLVRLMIGELRQGALRGLMVDAIAAAIAETGE